jgi:hypothetical protein
MVRYALIWNCVIQFAVHVLKVSLKLIIQDTKCVEHAQIFVSFCRNELYALNFPLFLNRPRFLSVSEYPQHTRIFLTSESPNAELCFFNWLVTQFISSILTQLIPHSIRSTYHVAILTASVISVIHTLSIMDHRDVNMSLCVAITDYASYVLRTEYYNTMQKILPLTKRCRSCRYVETARSCKRSYMSCNLCSSCSLLWYSAHSYVLSVIYSLTTTHYVQSTRWFICAFMHTTDRDARFDWLQRSPINRCFSQIVQSHFFVELW